MEIIDAQTHDPAPWRDWSVWRQPLEEDVRHQVICELAVASMDAVGVDAAVLSPSVGPEHDRWAAMAVTLYSERFIIQKTVDPYAEDVDAEVATAAAFPGVHALRAVLTDWRGGRGAEDLRQGRFDQFFAAAENASIPLFCFSSGDVSSLAGVAEQFSDLPLIVDHIGLPQSPVLEKIQNPFASLDDLLQLARYPNVAVKLCGVNVMSAMPYPHTDVWRNLHRVFEAFGSDRLMWASDYTRMRMVKPGHAWSAWYSDCLGYLRDTSEISEEDKAKIFGRTVRSWLKWPATEPLQRPPYAW